MSSPQATKCPACPLAKRPPHSAEPVPCFRGCRCVKEKEECFDGTNCCGGSTSLYCQLNDALDLSGTCEKVGWECFPFCPGAP